MVGGGAGGGVFLRSLECLSLCLRCLLNSCIGISTLLGREIYSAGVDNSLFGLFLSCFTYL